MITNTLIVSPVQTGTRSPMEIAQACYARWKSSVPFTVDLADYMMHGVVIARPDIFVMAKIVQLDGEPDPAWFTRIAVGNLKRLLVELPCYLPKICFCRRGDGRLRVYSTDRLLALAGSNNSTKD